MLAAHLWCAERPSNKGGIPQAVANRKKLRESLQPFWVEEADDDSRQVRDKICMCPGQPGP